MCFSVCPEVSLLDAESQGIPSQCLQALASAGRDCGTCSGRVHQPLLNAVSSKVLALSSGPTMAGPEWTHLFAAKCHQVTQPVLLAPHSWLLQHLTQAGITILLQAVVTLNHKVLARSSQPSRRRQALRNNKCSPMKDVCWLVCSNVCEAFAHHEICGAMPSSGSSLAKFQNTGRGNDLGKIPLIISIHC